MNEQAVDTAVRVSIQVAVPRERAFETFTRDIGRWWPRDHHLLQVEIVGMEFEPRVGGTICERGVDGSECRWARVLVWDPPERVVFSWDIDPQWQLERDASKASEVEVRFIEESASATRVELEHRRLERHGAGWREMRDGVSGPNGWPFMLEQYARSLA